jgi:hypothetical protein
VRTPTSVRPLVALAAAAAVAAPGARAAGGDLQLELGASAGADTNPARVAGGGERADGFALVEGRAKGTLTAERVRLAGDLSQAARLYPSVGEATASATRLDLGARAALGGGFAVLATALATDLTERGHRLDEDALDGAASLAWASGGWGASAGGGWRAFLPRDVPLRAFRAAGPTAALRASFAPAPDHALVVGYALWAAAYRSWPEAHGRFDHTRTASAEWSYRGGFAADLGYAYAWNGSTARGGAFERHRVTARAAAFLPLDLTLAVRGALQWSRYPDPAFVAAQLLLAQGDESLDALEVRLTRPLGERLELALGFALYAGEVALDAARAPRFTRAVVTTGLAWRARYGASDSTGTP